MMNFIDELNKYTNNEYKFMLKSALLDNSADFCVVEIFYKDGTILNAEVKEKLNKFAIGIFPKEFKYELRFVKNFISEERIESDFVSFMEEMFPSISYKLKSVKLVGMKFDIDVEIDNVSYEHAKDKHFPNTVQGYFKKMYEDYEFECRMTKSDVYVENQLEIMKQSYVEEDVDIYANRKIIVSDMVQIVGETLEDQASYIMDKTVSEERVVVCGKIKAIKNIVMKSKPKEKKEELTENEESENIKETEEPTEEPEVEVVKYQRKMYKWVLEDPTGSMNCVFFSNKENQSKLAPAPKTAKKTPAKTSSKLNLGISADDEADDK